MFESSALESPLIGPSCFVWRDEIGKHPAAAVDVGRDADILLRIELTNTRMDVLRKVCESAAGLEWAGIVVTRFGLVVVLVWIGSLKSFRYEADGIVPFVANSPLMHFFYRQPGREYRRHMNREGEVNPANREWHEQNRTYSFAHDRQSRA